MTGGAVSKLRTILFYLAQHSVILPVNVGTLATSMIPSSVNLSCSYKARWSTDSIVVHGDNHSAVSFL